MLTPTSIAALSIGLTAIVVEASVPVTVYNKCSKDVEFYDNSAVEVIAAGGTTSRTLAQGFSGMFRDGINPQATLAEFAVDGGFLWYDISIIPTGGPGPGFCPSLEECKAVTGGTGFNTPMEIAPSGCNTVTCLADGCPEAYLFPKDDTKTNACPDTTSVTLIFCPGGGEGPPQQQQQDLSPEPVSEVPTPPPTPKLTEVPPPDLTLESNESMTNGDYPIQTVPANPAVPIEVQVPTNPAILTEGQVPTNPAIPTDGQVPTNPAIPIDGQVPTNPAILTEGQVPTNPEEVPNYSQDQTEEMLPKDSEPSYGAPKPTGSYVPTEAEIPPIVPIAMDSPIQTEVLTSADSPIQTEVLPPTTATLPTEELAPTKSTLLTKTLPTADLPIQNEALTPTEAALPTKTLPTVDVPIQNEVLTPVNSPIQTEVMPPTEETPLTEDTYTNSANMAPTSNSKTQSGDAEQKSTTESLPQESNIRSTTDSATTANQATQSALVPATPSNVESSTVESVTTQSRDEGGSNAGTYVATGLGCMAVVAAVVMVAVGRHKKKKLETTELKDFNQDELMTPVTRINVL